MRKITIPILETVVFVHTCDDLRAFMAQRKESPVVEGLACTFYRINDTYRIPQVVFEGEPKIETIAHETVHIVNMLFQNHGLKLDLDNDEMQAYLTAFVFQKIYGFFYGKEKA